MQTSSAPDPRLLGIEIADGSQAAIAEARHRQRRAKRLEARTQNRMQQVNRLKQLQKEEEKNMGPEPTEKQKRHRKRLERRAAREQKRYERERMSL